MSEIRLIDANALTEYVRKVEDWESAYTICSYIDNAPTVEPTSVSDMPDDIVKDLKELAIDYGEGIAVFERKRPQGEWIKWNFKTFGAMGDWEYKCSNCEKVYGGEYNFCPNCGSDMRGKTYEND